MDTPCWVWTAHKKRQGYGVFKRGDKTVLAHRAAWIMTNGVIPHDGSAHGICVLHRCDNPACCRVEHLFLGTNLDNVLDKTAKGRNNVPCGDKHPARLRPERMARGIDNGSACLTVAQVQEIRALYATGRYTHLMLGVKFGVSKTTIGLIIRHKAWAHVPDDWI